jgi:hypothetical protein
MKKVVWLLFFLVGCIDPYVPSELKPAGAILVIDGHVENSGESTVKLTRSQNLLDDTPPAAETGATIQAEDDKGTKFTFVHQGNGIYKLPPQSFTAEKYRLYVKTSGGREYLSEFVPVVNSPAIDSISWEVASDLGIKIYANTHDDINPKGYYRWKFEETWQYTSKYQAVYIYNTQTRQAELRTDDIFNCWNTKNSTDILISSTSKLSKNQITEFPLTYINQQNERLRYTYSILVKQYAITEDAYSYWSQLKKTTEDLGTIFSPMPSQVAGNFRSLTDPNEPVLGYFSIGATSEKRIFINSLQVPRPNTYDIPLYEKCEQYELPMSNVSTFSGPFLLTYGIPNPNGPGIIGYYYSVTDCVDCRIAGGKNVKPDFWP